MTAFKSQLLIAAALIWFISDVEHGTC